MTTVSEPITTVSHPLEPLAAEEIAAAAALLRELRELPATARFVFIALHEPPKAFSDKELSLLRTLRNQAVMAFKQVA